MTKKCTGEIADALNNAESELSQLETEISNSKNKLQSLQQNVDSALHDYEGLLSNINQLSNRIMFADNEPVYPIKKTNASFDETKKFVLPLPRFVMFCTLFGISLLLNFSTHSHFFDFPYKWITNLQAYFVQYVKFFAFLLAIFSLEILLSIVNWHHFINNSQKSFFSNFYLLAGGLYYVLRGLLFTVSGYLVVISLTRLYSLPLDQGSVVFLITGAVVVANLSDKFKKDISQKMFADSNKQIVSEGFLKDIWK